MIDIEGQDGTASDRTPRATDDAPTVAPKLTSARRPVFGSSTFDLSLGDLAVVMLATGLLLAHAPFLYLPYWSLRIAIVVVALPAGLVALARLVRQRDPAALWLVAFLAVATVSTITSPSPLNSFRGKWGDSTFLLLYVGVAALWAIGRTASARAVRAAVGGIGLALAMNVVVGALQVLFDVQSGPLATLPGRASGLLANAVYYGAIVGGFTALCVAKYVASSRISWLAGACCFSFGAGLSGARVVAGAVLVVVVGIVLIHRNRAALYGLAATVAGLLLSSAFTAAVASNSTIARLGSKGGDGDGRLELWGFGLEALRQRPLLGWGLGNHIEATRQHYSFEFTRDYASSEWLQRWPDPHNVIIHLLVATGLLGVICLTGFVVAQVRRPGNVALLAMVVVIAATWLVEPVHIATLPFTVLAFGLAAPRLERREVDDGLGDRWPGAIKAGAFIGLVAMAYVVVIDYRFNSAMDSGDLEQAASSAKWFLQDGAVAADVGLGYSSRWASDEGYDREVLLWTTRAAELDDGNSYRWADLGRRQLGLDLVDEARRSMERSLELHPWSPMGWQVKYAYAGLTGDKDEEAEALDVICRLGLSLCPTLPLPEPASD